MIIQSKKISDLEKYKYKCEQLIKKINPYQILPITDEMLKDDYEIIKDPINEAEQKNYADLLKKTIENELIKNGLSNPNVNVEKIFNYGKIKLEREEYKKQLVLAHSMINSLKGDLEELTKENEEFKTIKDNFINLKNNESFIIDNNQLFDINRKLINYKENYEKINKDFEKLISEKRKIKKENNKLKKEIIDYKEQTIKLNKELDNIEINNNKINIQIDEEKNELISENKNLKDEINKLEKENITNKNKLIELNKKYKIEKDKLHQEISKLIKENLIKKEKGLKKYNNNFLIVDTEEVNKKMETIPLNRNNNDNNELLLVTKKYEDLVIKYSVLNKKYESLLNKYGKYQKEKDKIKELFNKRNLDKEHKFNEFKIFPEKTLELNNKKHFDMNINEINDSFDYNKIKYILWDIDNELSEKNKIILENKNSKAELENDIADKLKYYDKYITNNKDKIKNLLNQLLNLLILFKEKHDSLSKNNNKVNYVSNQFLVDIDKIINEINTINNIGNYDIELDDKIFFETINKFLSLLVQELILVYNKTYKYKKYNFHHRSKSEVTKNEKYILENDKNKSSDNIKILKEINELKRQNYFYIKQNYDLKNQIIDLNNKLSELILKYNSNQKTVSICNEGKKDLLNLMLKFLKNINNIDFAKIMYEILTLSEQINFIQINKCIVEEKLNLIIKNNQELTEEFSNNMEEFLLNEIIKLKKLSNDYDMQIIEKNEDLKKLNDEYLIKEKEYLNNIKQFKEKDDSSIRKDEELNN